MTQGPRTKIAFVMVGLPARGKSFIARKVARYLSWLGHSTRVFNVGAYRRERLGSHQPHSFFDPENESGNHARMEMARAALDDLIKFLEGDGEIGIYDATNTTRDRRRFVREQCTRRGIQVIFIESICNDLEIIDANVRETKARSPDYAGIAEDKAVSDFRMRIAHYESAYEEVADDEGSYIKTIDVGRTVVAHQVQGYIPARIVLFLINLHIHPRSIWLTRHGESVFNVLGRIGGDAPLSNAGNAYARSIAEYARAGKFESAPVVWTSTLKRTIETAATIGMASIPWRALDEIDAGVCDGMTYAEIAEKMPSEYSARAADKFRYRYPRGESYQDVIQRLEPVIFEIERERAPLLIIGHQAVLRALYAYLIDESPDACPRISIPLHTLIRITPTAYGCEQERISFSPTPDDPDGFRENGNGIPNSG